MGRPLRLGRHRGPGDLAEHVDPAGQQAQSPPRREPRPGQRGPRHARVHLGGRGADGAHLRTPAAPRRPPGAVPLHRRGLPREVHPARPGPLRRPRQRLPHRRGRAGRARRPADAPLEPGDPDRGPGDVRGPPRPPGTPGRRRPGRPAAGRHHRHPDRAPATRLRRRPPRRAPLPRRQRRTRRRDPLQRRRRVPAPRPRARRHAGRRGAPAHPRRRDPAGAHRPPAANAARAPAPGPR